MEKAAGRQTDVAVEKRGSQSAASALGFWMSDTWNQGLLEMLSLQGFVWRPLKSGEPRPPPVTRELWKLPSLAWLLRRVCVVQSLPNRMAELGGHPSRRLLLMRTIKILGC